MQNNLLFMLITPEGEKMQTECFSVNLVAADNNSGNGGGSIGILHGHLPAVIALKNPSDIVVKSENAECKITVSGGFAEVKDNIVTVITENCVKL